MPRFEVGVRDFEHITVEADDAEAAKEKAREESGFDEPEAYQAVALDDRDTSGGGE